MSPSRLMYLFFKQVCSPFCAVVLTRQTSWVVLMRCCAKMFSLLADVVVKLVYPPFNANALTRVDKCCSYTSTLMWYMLWLLVALDRDHFWAPVLTCRAG